MSLIESYVKDSNPLLAEIDKLKSRLAVLEHKFDNEIIKRRGPKSKIKDTDVVGETFHDIKDIIFIEKEKSTDANEVIVIHKNGSDTSAPIIALSDSQLDALIESVSNAKIGDYVTIKEYNILNKIAQKDDIGDWLLPVSK